MTRNDYNDFVARIIQDYFENSKDFLPNLKAFRVSLEMIEGLAESAQFTHRAFAEGQAQMAAATVMPAPKRGPGRPPKALKGKPGRPKKAKA